MFALLIDFLVLYCLGEEFSNIWDVSNAAMRRHDISGLWKLSCLTSVIELLPLTLIFLLPSNAEEQEILAKSPVSISFCSILGSCQIFYI